MIKRLLYILIICLFAVNSWGATYNYYFSDDATGNATGNDGNNCTSSGTACKTLSKLNTLIDALGSGDTVNAYFDRSDTWSCDTEALVGSAACFTITSSNPRVNFQAYGSGTDPIFDGQVTDFSSVANSDCSASPPCFYSSFFWIQRGDCSFDNITLQRIYGFAIFLGSATVGGDGFTFSNGLVQHFGSGGIRPNQKVCIEDAVVEYSTFYKGEQLLEYGKKSGWGAAINFACSQYGDNSLPQNNTVRYSLVYDIYGEGINNPNGITEYNLVGDTGSVAINIATHDWDAFTAVVRYNFITMSNWSTSVYDGLFGSDPEGIRVFDELVGGDNSNADISIYGNIVINRNHGIWFFQTDDPGNPFGSVKIYNNLIIDSHVSNITARNLDECSAGYVYNNSSILYHQTASVHTRDNSELPHGNWTIQNNAFWTSGGLEACGGFDGNGDWDCGFNTSVVTTDPILPGEALSVDWDGQSGASYYDDIDFVTHLLPVSGSLLDAAKTLGAGFTDNLPATGTDWKAGVDGVFVLNTGGEDIGPFSVDGSVGSGTGLEGIIPLGVILQ